MSAFLRVKLNIDTPAKAVEATPAPEPPAVKRWLKKLYQRRKVVAKGAIAATVALLLMLMLMMLRWRRPSPQLHTTNHLVKLRCRRDSNTYRCEPAFVGGIFVVRAAECASIFDINGYPWHAVKSSSHEGAYEVPYATSLVVKDVDPTCSVAVYQDTSRSVSPVPQCLTWTTAGAVETFTLASGDDVVIDRVPSDLLEIARQGPWRAFFFDWDPGDQKFEFVNLNEPLFTYGCRHT